MVYNIKLNKYEFHLPIPRSSDKRKEASIRQLSNSLFVFRNGEGWIFHQGTYRSVSEQGRTAFIRLWAAFCGTPSETGLPGIKTAGSGSIRRFLMLYI